MGDVCGLLGLWDEQEPDRRHSGDASRCPHYEEPTTALGVTIPAQALGGLQVL
ncbi:MAG: hypothetical protein AAGD09_14365 [Cyanobacteria bacterium P01_F01_bin.56]